MLDEIETKFNMVTIKYGEMRLYRFNDALNIIKECEARRKKIVGFDSFRYFVHSIQPVMEYSYDYSKLPMELTWCKAKHDIRQCESMGFVFEIVYK